MRLTVPAAGGVDSTALIVGDFSNGNDGIVLKGKGKKLADIKGQPVNLVQLSVSHYLLARALESVSLRERDIKVVKYRGRGHRRCLRVRRYDVGGDVEAATGGRHGHGQHGRKSSTRAGFPARSSTCWWSQCDAQIESGRLGRALVGAWYETMAMMSAGDAKSAAALSAMAKASGTDLAGYKGQLLTTRLFTNRR